MKAQEETSARADRVLLCTSKLKLSTRKTWSVRRVLGPVPNRRWLFTLDPIESLGDL